MAERTTSGITGAAPAGGGVAVGAPARLHLGFLDLAGGLGRRFGSLGLALDGVETRLRVLPGEGLTAQGPAAARALRYAEALLANWHLPRRVRLELERAIPEHVGLGSGTQLGLAIGVGMARLFGLDHDARAVARLVERGARSGIGLGAFEQGGLLLDGGLGASKEPPPIIARLPFPPNWRVLLILDEARRGVHGEAEIRAFQALPPFPGELAGQLCRLVVMQLLPAAAEGDVVGFGRAVGELQRAVGDHFAPAQGGRFASREIGRVLAWLEAEGVAGVGQSSWGPTGFAVIGEAEQGLRLRASARRRFAGASSLRFLLCRGRNDGALIRSDADAAWRASA